MGNQILVILYELRNGVPASRTARERVSGVEGPVEFVTHKVSLVGGREFENEGSARRRLCNLCECRIGREQNQVLNDIKRLVDVR